MQIQKILKDIKKINHTIYKIKILLQCINDSTLNDKLNYVVDIYNELIKNIEKYQLDQNPIVYNLIDNDYFTINNIIKELEEDLYPKFKMVSVIYLDNLKEEEIIQFYSQLNNILKEYKNIQSACEYIYYHSGKEISLFINNLLNYIKKAVPENSFRRLPISYLEKNLNIITIFYKEWIELFKQLNFTMKYISNESNDEYLKLKEQYQKLLIYYFIVITEGK